MRKFFVVTALFLALITLLSCSGGSLELKLDGDHYVDSNGKRWYAAPLNFEPTAKGEEVAHRSDIPLYSIPDMEPENWMAEEYEGIGGVFYSEDVTLPTLSTMGANSAVICREDVITVGIGKIDNTALIVEMILALTEGEAVSLVQTGEPYHIKFTSPEYPGLYYDILYIEGDDGKYYFYDRGLGKTVECGRMLAEYLPTNEELLAQTEAPEADTAEGETA